MPPNVDDVDAQILKILADYSHDLSELKKRDGKLPAQAAVDRIEALYDAYTAERVASILDDVERLIILRRTSDGQTISAAKIYRAIEKLRVERARADTKDDKP
jgi:hypothetical protein